MGSRPVRRDSLAVVLRAVHSAIDRCCAETGYGQLRIAITLYARDWVAVQLRFGSDHLFKISRAEFSSMPLLPLDRQDSLSELVAHIEDAMRWCAEEGFGEVVVDIMPARKGMQAVIKRATTAKCFFLQKELDLLPA